MMLLRAEAIRKGRNERYRLIRRAVEHGERGAMGLNSEFPLSGGHAPSQDPAPPDCLTKKTDLLSEIVPHGSVSRL
jgi:hypothetical protein